jgi:hypothetical protein
MPRKKPVLEKDVEQYLRDAVRSVGGEAYKFTSPNRRSVPDRVCVFPQSDGTVRIVFVECKRPGSTWTEKQKRERDRLLRLGCEVELCDDFTVADEIVSLYGDDV